MPTYAIGDIQGCFDPLRRLLDAVRFDPAVDRLWLTGDLVNRGPDSLAVLRWARGLGERVVCVLGNHDLHLLAVACGARRRKRKDTLEAVLGADDREELLGWLRRRPLLVREDGWLLVHAGLLPVWTAAQAAALAREAEAALRGPGWAEAVGRWCARDAVARWRDDLDPQARLQVAVRAMTMLRACPADGRSLDLTYKGGRAQLPAGLCPWFEHPLRASRDVRIVCGHWALLGLHVAEDVVALDTGCVWGQALTAFRLEDGAVTQVACDRPA